MNRTTKQIAKMMLRVRRMVIVEPLKERGGRLQGCMAAVCIHKAITQIMRYEIIM